MAEFKKVFTLVTDEIINKGFSASHFLKWISSHKPGGQQLENWTEPEMIEVIQEYKKAAQEGNFLCETELKDSNSDSDQEDDVKHDSTELRDKSPSKLTPTAPLGEFQTIRITKIEKQKKSLFGSRLVFTLTIRPDNLEVTRRRSDFEWLFTKLQTDPRFSQKKGDWQKLKDKDDVQKFLLEIESTPGLLQSHEFLKWFLTCQDPSAVKERKKRDGKLKGESGTPSNTNMLSARGSQAKQEHVQFGNFGSASKMASDRRASDQLETGAGSQKDKDQQNIQEAYSSIKVNQETLKQLKRHTEDLYFLMEQMHGKTEKIASCFGKLSETWSKTGDSELTKLTPRSVDLAAGYSELKLMYFQWSQSLETSKNLLKKNIMESAEKLCLELSDIKKALKPLKSSSGSENTPKKAIDSSDLAFMECLKARKLEQEHIAKWRAQTQMVVQGSSGKDAGTLGMEHLRVLQKSE